MIRRHLERHYSGRTGWLRATVLGANDGIVSIASSRVAASDAPHNKVLIVGVAADFISDGTIDPADYVVWRKTGGFLQAVYDTWRTNFGEPAGSGTAPLQMRPSLNRQRL